MNEQITIEEILRQAVDPSESRHKGNPQSVAAHEKIVRSKSQTYQKILAYVRQRGGATSKEIALGLGYGAGVNKISGRLSELRYSNPPRLKDSGLRRGGAAVLVEAVNIWVEKT